MVDAKLLSLHFIIFMLNFGGIHGVGDAADKENDLLFAELTEVKAEQQQNDDYDQKMAKTTNKCSGKIKTEPILDQQKDKADGEKNCQQKIKTEPKIEEANTLDALREKWHTKSDQNDGPYDQNGLEKSADHRNKMESEQKKLAIVNAFGKRENQRQNHVKTASGMAHNDKLSLIKRFDKMKNKLKMQNKFKREHRNKIESEIAWALGTHRRRIYEWKKELCEKPEPKSKEKKLEIVKRFDKMRQENCWRLTNGRCKGKERLNMEIQIANALGINRVKIYEWKRELALSKRRYTKEQRRKILEHFGKLKEEFAHKFNAKMSNKIEEKIARKFGLCKSTIYKWRKRMGETKDKKPNRKKPRLDKSRKDDQIST